MENPQFSKIAQSIVQLDQSLDQLRELARHCGVPSPEHQDWYALLKHKLIPQLLEKAFLIVAVMGGTNTGKSLIFNHLVGEAFSGVDHRASGTKHPVCLVPKTDGTESFESILGRHFDSFKLINWDNPEQALSESETHHLFWIEGRNVPERLLLLDTPDIDSDRQVNWDRARAVRHAADVLIAVLTEQKYNDAAVRKFFREAVEAQKPIIVVFNMFDLEGDVKHLPRWMEQFCEEIGGKPLSVLVSPHDKVKAESFQLPFFIVEDFESENARIGESVDLGNILSDLHFDAIKSQTLIGALNVLNNPTNGVRAYLHSVESASKRFAEALRTLENVGETKIDWPGMPTFLLAEEIRAWWNDRRPGWSQNINDAYRSVGGYLTWPIKKASQYVSKQYLGRESAQNNPLADFQEREHAVVLEFAEKIIGQLEDLAETENPVLRRELLDLVGGENRAKLIDRAHSVLNSLEPVDADFRTALRKNLSDWAEQNPQAVGWIRSLDHIATVARPVITVSLFATGGWLGAEAVGQVVGGTFATVGGETVLHAGTEGAKYGTATLFQKIQRDFVFNRSRRFIESFQKELWKDVVDRLKTGAEVVQSDAFLRCKNWRAENTE